MGSVNINRKKEFLGAGWSFPITFSVGNYQLEVTRYENNIKDSIDIIMQTNFGERPMNPQFGSGLQQYFFQEMNETLKAEIKDTVTNSLLNNEPRISVLNVEVDYADVLEGLVEVTIDYEYNQTNTRHNYVYPFYLKEGTNL
ncbi:GPW/gp25 family protein [Tenacibaculum larymnensis]|uniref:GPW/gp25 family protein n=1 Tax=Tenacibaculum larymnensis TaxID=2878201 RepID=A0A9X4ILV4_9FLAO|nr:GPW/gp25 family protein [Tenacibaculum larymnensis]MDE1206978.1 GPW/gp25 family protein [Tenacibaculum larymnensis]